MPRACPALRALTAALVLLPAPSLRAQEIPAIQPGALMRVSHLDGARQRRVAGTLVAIDADSIVLAVDRWSRGTHQRLALPRAAVRTIELGRVESHMFRDGTIGALVGVVAGFRIGGGRRCHSCATDEVEAYKAYSALVGAGVGLVAGAVLGTVVGGPRVHWTPVPPPR